MMTSKKGQEFKRGLAKEYRSNQRAPVWVYLKTQVRDYITGSRKKHWRARNSKKGKRVRKRLEANKA